MLDLTALEKPFGLLDVATKQALQTHGGPWEVFIDGKWQPKTTYRWQPAYAYRVKPPIKAARTPREWWISGDGRVFAYPPKPGRLPEAIHVREVLP